MHFKELGSYVADTCEVSPECAEDVITTALLTIHDTVMIFDEEIMIRGFGRFFRSKTKPRRVNNFKNETVTVIPNPRVRFISSKKKREIVLCD